MGTRTAALRGHNIAMRVLTWSIDSKLLVRVSKDEILKVCFRYHLSALLKTCLGVSMPVRPPVGRDPSGSEGVNFVDIAFFRLSPLRAVSNLADSECPRYTTPYLSFPVRSVVISPHQGVPCFRKLFSEVA